MMDDNTSKDVTTTSSAGSSHEKDDVEKGGATETDTPQTDPNIVNWDGPDDPENPMNWSKWRKILSATMLSFITFLTPLASSMIAPAVEAIMLEFHSDNTFVGAFIVTGYLIGYCMGPLVIAPLSEIYGRAPVYNVCNLIFLVFNIACAVSQNAGSLIVFRILAGVGGSGPLTLGAGTLADIISQEKRGFAMSLWVLGPLIGPTFGPLASGYLTQAAGWRWSFWLLSIASGLAAVVIFFAMSESYAYVILDKKTKRLRKETGNPNLRSALSTGRSPKDLFVFSIFRPLKLLFLQPIVFLLSLYQAVLYGYLYLLFTTFPVVFQGIYGFSEGSTGLVYLGNGIGSFLGLVALAKFSDQIFQKLKARNGGVAKPEFRLPPTAIGGFLVPIALFWYGWAVDKHVHWIVPILGTSLLGTGIIIVFMSTSTYLVDAFTMYAASATAATTVLRSLVGAFLPLAGPSMYASLGLGWGNSLLGFIAVGMVPIPFLLLKYGERIRNSNIFHVDF